MPEVRTSSSESHSQPQQRARNFQRRQLEADTENLLKLATDLKEQVDKAPNGTSPVDVIRKADEIGKLARKIQQEAKR